MSTTSTLYIIYAGAPDDNDRALAALCAFMGLEGRLVDAAEFSGNKERYGSEKLHAAVSAGAVAAMAMGPAAQFRACVTGCVASLFIYGVHEGPSIINALGHLTSGAVSGVSRSAAAGHAYKIADRQICRELSGLTIRPAQRTSDFVFETDRAQGAITDLISIDGRPFLMTATVGETTLFVTGGSSIADVRKPASSDFDTTQVFSTLFPAALYLRHVFGDACWHKKKAQACLIVDDPLLHNKYGYLDYRQLLTVMDRYNFTTSIGFIPWNYKRTTRDVAALFSERSDRLSLCVHGCDHTRSEFGALDNAGLTHMIRSAMFRMKRHQEMTGLCFDNVMVFPQGVFSTQAMRLLKCNGYLAAVNLEAFPVDFDGPVSIASFLEPAITSFSGFPLFLRRYPHQLTEMALDLFWDRPVLMLAHHDFFGDGCAHAADAVGSLNSLNTDIEWDSVGNIIRTSYRSKKGPEGAVHIKTYACETMVTNDTAASVDYLVEKEESPPLPVAAVFANGGERACLLSDGALSARLTLAAGERQTIRIVYPDNCADSPDRRLPHRGLSTATRRYLSEVRDNYISKNRLLLSCAMKLKDGLFP